MKDTLSEHFAHHFVLEGWQYVIHPFVMIWSGAPDGTVLQNIYSADNVSWLAKSAEQIMNLCKRGAEAQNRY